ncbi:hypothetical protein [Tardiphaga sp.]|uniref:hypothetical protein n=1 Tax=Alphaproteobacteria TaxID=28211 RepID=UPI00352A9456
MPMLRILIFDLLYVGCCLFALIRGGAPERLGALILIADFELSLLVVEPMSGRFSGVEWSVFFVDLFAFFAVYLLSILSARYWPIWVAAVQGAVTMSHLTGLRSDIVPWAYGSMVAIWSYLLLIMLAVATWRHRRRLKRYRMDPAWSWQLPSWYLNGGRVDDHIRFINRAVGRPGE